MAAAPVADLAERASRRRVALVIRESVATMDNELILHSSGVWQSIHLGRVIASHHSRRLEYQPASRSRTHKSRFCAGDLSDNLASGMVQFVHVDHRSGGFIYRILDLWSELAPTVRRG